jgi:hypothetical protein
LRVRPIALLPLHRIPAREFLSKSINYFLGNSAVSEQRSHGAVVQVFRSGTVRIFSLPLFGAQVGDLNRCLFKCHYRPIRNALWSRRRCRLGRDLSFNDPRQLFLACANEIVGLLGNTGSVSVYCLYSGRAPSIDTACMSCSTVTADYSFASFVNRTDRGSQPIELYVSAHWFVLRSQLGRAISDYSESHWAGY